MLSTILTPETAAVVAVISLAYFVQSAFGFGSGLIAIPLLSLIIDPKDAIVLMTFFSTALGVLVIKLRKSIAWNKILLLMPGFLIGFALGLSLFSMINQRALGIVIAVYILLYVIMDFVKIPFLASAEKSLSLKLQAATSGLTSGFVEGIMGTGGPMLVTFLKAHSGSVTQFRATVMCSFLFANLLRVVFLGSNNLIHGNVVQDAIITIPFFAVSVYFGNHLPKKLNERTFHKAINILLLCSAGSVLIKNCL
jgi:uncharacterized protein